MGKLVGLKPEKVFKYFEEICAIPHGSGQTKAISDYLVSFAKERGLYYRQDDANNVIIKKAATIGYEGAPTVMIQGHVDMVCDQDVDCTKDMSKEGLDIFVDGDQIGAHGTTLGGDDGIAVAMALAVLDTDDGTICHGPLECVFTTDEEIGMIGARALDTSDLEASYLLNLDSEVEKVLTVSCAGSTRTICTLPAKRAEYDGTLLMLSVNGLVGGHSGEEIHKGRASATHLLGRILYVLSQKTDLRVVELNGGAKDNAISHSAYALLCAPEPEKIYEAAANQEAELRKEYHTMDPGITIQVTDSIPVDLLQEKRLPMTQESTQRGISFLLCAPQGVMMMSPDVPGLVQTSLNLGRVYTKENEIICSFMIRSSVNSQKDAITAQVEALTKALGGSMEITAAYSAWEYRPDSRLREIMIDAFRTVYGEEPKIEALHAGLECGILSGKMPELDCISFGPDLIDIHTHRERMGIDSTRRTWELLLETLGRLK